MVLLFWISSHDDLVMSYVKPQRPAAPWAFHNWWGQFTTAATLPNTATSDIQVASDELQAGDIAWAEDTSQLYVCTDPTAGAAVWVALAGGGGGVTSFEGRTGAVVSQTGDYLASEIDNDSGVAGAQVSDGLNTLNTSKVALGGQLGGTVASPDVRGLRETGGPTLLTLGAIADGEVLQRSGATIIGATVSGGPTVLGVDTSVAGPWVANLPALPAAGTRYIVHDTGGQAQANAITVSPNGGDTIEDQTAIYLVTDGASVTLISDGSQWRIESWSTGQPPYAGLTGLDASNTYAGSAGQLPGTPSMLAEALLIPLLNASTASIWGNMEPSVPEGWRLWQDTTFFGFEIYHGGGGPAQATSAIRAVNPSFFGRRPLHLLATVEDLGPGTGQNLRFYVQGQHMATTNVPASQIVPSTVAPSLGITTFANGLTTGVLLGASYDGSPASLLSDEDVADRYREVRKAGRLIAGSLDPAHRYDAFDALEIPATLVDVGSTGGIDLSLTGTPVSYRDSIW